MGKKVISTIYVDEEVLNKAKELGFNISKTCENALKESIRRLEGSSPQIINAKGGIGTVGSDVAGPLGFEPRTSGSAGQRPNPG